MLGASVFVGLDLGQTVPGGVELGKIRGVAGMRAFVVLLQQIARTDPKPCGGSIRPQRDQCPPIPSPPQSIAHLMSDSTESVLSSGKIWVSGIGTASTRCSALCVATAATAPNSANRPSAC